MLNQYSIRSVGQVIHWLEEDDTSKNQIYNKLSHTSILKYVMRINESHFEYA